MIPDINDIIRNIGVEEKDIYNIYIYGSRVYGTYNNQSDWDIIVIANIKIESTEIRKGIFNIHIYTPDKFQKDLDYHRINNLECIYAPKWAKIKENIKFNNFKINKNILRHSLSQISSNSWVKCNKKISDGEYYIGVKSLFHSIRIPMFGIQICEYGEIVDYSVANNIWSDIRDNRYTWSELDRKYRPILNSTLTNFRRLAPKI